MSDPSIGASELRVMIREWFTGMDYEPPKFTIRTVTFDGRDTRLVVTLDHGFRMIGGDWLSLQSYLRGIGGVLLTDNIVSADTPITHKHGGGSGGRHPDEYTSSYRDQMRDAGRGHLLP